MDGFRGHLQGQWVFEVHSTVDSATLWLESNTPELAVLDVDVPKGWNVCTQIKKAFSDVPVIVVSQRFGHEVFVEHQKLETRADAYHTLPQDEEALGMSLSLYATRVPDPHRDKSQSGFRVLSRQRLHSTQSRGIGPLPGTDLVSRLEGKSASQAREIEHLRQTIEALEAERDAVRENAHRQAMQLMSLQPGAEPTQDPDVLPLKQRVAQLEGEALELQNQLHVASMATKQVVDLKAERKTLADDLNQIRLERESEQERAEARYRASKAGYDGLEAELASLKRTLDSRVAGWAAERLSLQKQVSVLDGIQGDDTLLVSVESLDLDRARDDARDQANEAADQLALASKQLGQLAAELGAAQRERAGLRAESAELEARVKDLTQRLQRAEGDVAGTPELQNGLVAAVERAETAERAWSTVNARLEQAMRLLDDRQHDLEHLSVSRKEMDAALATSRKLMREYATDAARKAEELRGAGEKTRALEAQIDELGKKYEDARGDAAFQRSLVNMLETEVAVFKAASSAGTGPRGADPESAAIKERLAEAGQAAAAFGAVFDATRTELDALVGRMAQEFRDLQLGLERINSPQPKPAANKGQRKAASDTDLLPPPPPPPDDTLGTLHSLTEGQ